MVKISSLSSTSRDSLVILNTLYSLFIACNFVMLVYKFSKFSRLLNVASCKSKYLLDNSDLILHDNSATIVTGTDLIIKNLIAFFKGQFLLFVIKLIVFATTTKTYLQVERIKRGLIVN